MVLALLLTALILLEGLTEAGATVVLALLQTALILLEGLTGAGSGSKSPTNFYHSQPSHISSISGQTI